LQEMQYSYI